MRYFLLLICLFANFFLLAQTQWSGVVNTYHEVTAVDPCGFLTVSDVSGLAVNQGILLIQMQGAAINESNDNDFGSITALNSAGLYEIGRIAEINGNTLRLYNRLVNTYQPGAGLQVVGTAEATAAQVLDVLTAPAWNGTTGGVVHLRVANALTLQADINVSGLGFRGGERQLTTNNCSGVTFADDYFYAAGNWRGAAKGEGIAAAIAGKTWGRGAAANAGGGGNDHNTGGGGGANAATGGNGGESSPPSVFGCKGLFPGEPGNLLAPTGERFYLGGGGGAGHVNNNTANDVVGNGGGIVIVEAGLLNFEGGNILAAGLSPSAINGDGGSGGGAGGTVVLLIDDYSAINVDVSGGNGGDVINPNNRCFGPGGGGSGGVIYDNSSMGMVIPQVSGGAAGTNSQAANCNGLQNGATAGSNGQRLFFPFNLTGGTVSNTVLVELSAATGPAPCPGDTICLQLTLSAGGLDAVDWQFSTGGGFSSIAGLPGTFEPAIGTLKYPISQDTPPEITFRALPAAACYTTEAIDSETFTIATQVDAAFTQSLLDQTVTVTLTDPTGVDSVRFDFGAGDPPVAGSPAAVTYAASGTYTITATAFGPCGPVSTTQTVTITAPNLPPTAGFTADDQTGCAPLSVSFSSTSTDASALLWSFPGGSPATSAATDPQVTYSDAGTFPVQLIATNGVGSDTLLQTAFVTVAAGPTAGFTVVVSGNTVSVSTQATGADSYLYDFGDGNSSTLPDPTYTYPASGSVTITQTVSNACGNATTTQTVQLGMPPTAVIGSSTGGGCAPLLVTFADQSTGNVATRAWSFPGGSPTVSTDSVVNVLYDQPGRFPVMLTVANTLGDSQAILTDSIDVRPFPTAEFTFDTDGLTTQFNNLSADGTTYLWDFGDGNSSSAENPVHTYAEAGLYDVTLTVSNPYCASAQTFPVLVELTGVQSPAAFGAVRIFPNPIEDEFTVQLERLPSNVSLHVLDVRGQILRSQKLTTAKTTIRVADLPEGVYFLQVRSATGRFVERLVKLYTQK